VGVRSFINRTNESAATNIVLRSSAPLTRAYTNDVDPLFATPDPEAPLRVREFNTHVQQQVENFVKYEVMENDTHIPLSLLSVHFAEAALTTTNAKPQHPLIAPEVEELGRRVQVWESSIRHYEPQLIESSFYVDRLPKELLIMDKKEDEFRYRISTTPLEPTTKIPASARAKRFLRENNRGAPRKGRPAGKVSTNPKPPPQNLFQKPALIRPPFRGSALACFRNSMRKWFILHAGGKLMSDLLLSELPRQGEKIESICMLPGAINVAGDIQQIQVRYSILGPNQSQRIVMRYLNHCFITELHNIDTEPEFEVLDCLEFPDGVSWCCICPMSGDVSISDQQSNLYLWQHAVDGLRVIQEHKVPLPLIAHRPQTNVLSTIDRRSFTIKDCFSRPVYNKCSFSIFPQSLLFAQGDALFRFDYREPYSVQIPLHIVKPGGGPSEVHGLTYHWENPFYFSVNNMNSVLLFDERNTSVPVKTWDCLQPLQPTHNIQFLPTNPLADIYPHGSIFGWSVNSGKSVLVPVEEHNTRSWEQELRSPGLLPFLVPGYRVNDYTSACSYYKAPLQPYPESAKHRYKWELDTIGAQLLWCDDSLSASETNQSDEFLYVQLSRLGDVYCESFRFGVTSSMAYASSTPFYDHDSHLKEVLVRESPRNPSFEQFFIYDITKFLHKLITDSHAIYKPEGFDKHVEEIDLPPESNTEETDPKPEKPLRRTRLKTLVLENPPPYTGEEDLLEYLTAKHHPTTLYALWQRCKRRLAITPDQVLDFLLDRSVYFRCNTPQEARFWKDNELYDYIIERTSKNSIDDEKVIFYVWLLANIDVAFDLTIANDAPLDLQLFSIMFVRHETYTIAKGHIYTQVDTQPQKSSLAAAKITKKPVRIPNFMRPGELHARKSQYRVRPSALPERVGKKFPLYRQSFSVDIERLQSAWGTDIPAPGADGGNFSVPPSSGTAANSVLGKRRGVNSSQGSFMTPQRPREPSKSQSQASQTRRESFSASQPQPSQEDISALFDLLG